VQKNNQVDIVICIACLHIPWDPGGTDGIDIPSIAWGQAMFRAGGNVIPARDDILGGGIMGRGPSQNGLLAAIIVYKAERQQERAGIEQNRIELKKLNSSSLPVCPPPGPLLLQVRWLPQATIVSTSRPDPHRRQRGVTGW
jgi:hypothetical protein